MLLFSNRMHSELRSGGKHCPLLHGLLATGGGKFEGIWVAIDIDF
jgi:hypothetical protein